MRPVTFEPARPTAVGHAEAVALPLGALTAWQALHEHAHSPACGHYLATPSSAAPDPAAMRR